MPTQYSVRVPEYTIDLSRFARASRSPARLPWPVVCFKPATERPRLPCTDLSRSRIRTSRASICKAFRLAGLAVNLADLCASFADPGATRAIASCGRHRPMRKACTCLPEACGPWRNTRGPGGKPCGPCREACTCLRATCGCLRGQGGRGRRLRSRLASSPYRTAALGPHPMSRMQRQPHSSLGSPIPAHAGNRYRCRKAAPVAGLTPAAAPQPRSAVARSCRAGARAGRCRRFRRSGSCAQCRPACRRAC